MERYKCSVVRWSGWVLVSWEWVSVFRTKEGGVVRSFICVNLFGIFVIELCHVLLLFHSVVSSACWHRASFEQRLGHTSHMQTHTHLQAQLRNVSSGFFAVHICSRCI